MNKNNDMGYDKHGEGVEDFDLRGINEKFSASNDMDDLSVVENLDVMGDEPTTEDLQELDNEVENNDVEESIEELDEDLEELEELELSELEEPVISVMPSLFQTAVKEISLLGAWNPCPGL